MQIHREVRAMVFERVMSVYEIHASSHMLLKPGETLVSYLIQRLPNLAIDQNRLENLLRTQLPRSYPGPYR